MGKIEYKRQIIIDNVDAEVCKQLGGIFKNGKCEATITVDEDKRIIKITPTEEDKIKG